MNKDLNTLLDDYFKGNLSTSEEQDLCRLLKESEHKKSFANATIIDLLLNRSLMDENVFVGYDQLLNELENRRGKAKNRRYYNMGLVACFIGIFMMFGVFYFYHENTNGPVRNISLFLEDGTFYDLENKESDTLIDSKGFGYAIVKDETIDYYTYGKGNGNGEGILQKLYIPEGKTFKVILQDSSVVVLNSKTVFSYPSIFKDNKTVSINGEGYFTIVKDKKNPFIVHSETMDVKVLGTEFNLSAYSDDRELHTALVDGSVELVTKNQSSYFLQPGELATWTSKNTSDLKISKQNLTEYVSWKDGILMFRFRRFDQILKVLERRYRVKIKSKYPELNNKKFIASFETETLKEVLEAFQFSHRFDYELSDDCLVIKKPK